MKANDQPKLAWRGLLATLILVCSACAGPDEGVPRLTVLIVVDQTRAELLDRFAPEFDSGFARLSEEGLAFSEAHHDHAYTWTAAGHATLTSGVHPSRHGVIGNQWWDRERGRIVGAVADANARIVGFPDRASASPYALRVSTLGDWLLEESPGSRVWSVSVKDRSAIPAGGRQPSGAFWYDAATGRFVTSNYYADREPAWVNEFHLTNGIERYREDWELSIAPAHSRQDEFAAERDPSTFPHRFSEGNLFYREVVVSPFADAFTLDFATALLENEELGTDETPDLLILSLSAADYIGHAYGPFSVEVEDHFLRLDRMLGAFFDELDRHAGHGNWLVALTSDHGVVPLPEQSRLDGKDAQRVLREELYGTLKRSMNAALSDEGLPADAIRVELVNGLAFSPTQEIPPDVFPRVRRAVADDLIADPRIEDVFTWDELAAGEASGRTFEDLFRNSFDPQRSSDLMPRFRELDLPSRAAYGTNHGSPYRYDTHVPLVFLGRGIESGRVPGRHATVDVAPTLAACLGLLPRPGLDGHAIEGICER